MERAPEEEVVIIGVPEIDGEHALQHQLIDGLAAILGRAGASAAEREQAADQLVDCTSVHFLSEELLMRLYAYPQQRAHAVEHERMMERAREILATPPRREPAAGSAVVRALRAWQRDHVRGPDLAFAAWCGRNRIAPR